MRKLLRSLLLRRVGEAAAQEERNRLARDLHDSIKQQLFSINVGAATAQERWERDPEGARKALAGVRRSAKEALVEMQALLHQLRPQALGSIQGLVEALREQCEALGYRSGAEVTVELGPEIPEDRVPPGTPEALFRMAQEALANVARHARARHVRLWLGRESDTVQLRVEDDGQGFEPATASPGMGLRSLRERAELLHGALEIESTPGTGTKLVVRIPLPPPPAAARRAKVERAEAWGALQQMVMVAFLLLSEKAPFIRQELKSFPNLIAFFSVAFFVWVWSTPPGRFTELSYQAFLPLTLVIGWALASSDAWNPVQVACDLGYVLYVAFASVRLHRSTSFRRFWRKGARIWLGLIMLAETGILLALRTLPLSLPETVYLSLLGLGFLYISSRQPRPEGSPA